MDFMWRYFGRPMARITERHGWCEYVGEWYVWRSMRRWARPLAWFLSRTWYEDLKESWQ